jgi:predicted O-methyltransferase YrrM
MRRTPYPIVFARGMTISTEVRLNKNREYWTECGKALQRFSTFCKNDPRIDTILMPVYDGVTFIKWKQ